MPNQSKPLFKKPHVVLAGIVLTIAGGASGDAEGLVIKYHSQKILQGSSENFRMNAVHSPLPAYPTALSMNRKQGLVVVELAVSYAGKVVDSNILETFDARASAAVITGLQHWQFYSAEALDALRAPLPCGNCLRVNRLAFDFRIDHGRALVIDLAAAEIARTHLPSPLRTSDRRDSVSLGK
jgi:hypothetical protein